MPKSYVYAPIPEFNQQTQFVAQQAPVDMGDRYFVGIEIHGLTNTDETDELLLQEMGVAE